MQPQITWIPTSASKSQRTPFFKWMLGLSFCCISEFSKPIEIDFIIFFQFINSPCPIPPSLCPPNTSLHLIHFVHPDTSFFDQHLFPAAFNAQASSPPHLAAENTHPYKTRQHRTVLIFIQKPQISLKPISADFFKKCKRKKKKKKRTEILLYSLDTRTWDLKKNRHKSWKTCATTGAKPISLYTGFWRRCFLLPTPHFFARAPLLLQNCLFSRWQVKSSICLCHVTSSVTCTILVFLQTPGEWVYFDNARLISWAKTKRQTLIFIRLWKYDLTIQK